MLRSEAGAEPLHTKRRFPESVRVEPVAGEESPLPSPDQIAGGATVQMNCRGAGISCVDSA